MSENEIIDLQTWTTTATETLFMSADRVEKFLKLLFLIDGSSIKFGNWLSDLLRKEIITNDYKIIEDHLKNNRSLYTEETKSIIINQYRFDTDFELNELIKFEDHYKQFVTILKTRPKDSLFYNAVTGATKHNLLDISTLDRCTSLLTNTNESDLLYEKIMTPSLIKENNERIKRLTTTSHSWNNTNLKVDKTLIENIVRLFLLFVLIGQ